MRTVLQVLALLGFFLAAPEAWGQTGSFRDRERSGMFEILFAPSDATTVPIGRDTTPPRVMRAQVVTHPDDPARRRIQDAGNLFVGIGMLEFRITCSEPMAVAPKVRLLQQGGFALEGALTDSSANPLFVYRLFPVTAPQANGPATLEVSGRFTGGPGDSGIDRANNPLVAFQQQRAVLVDTLPPGLLRITPGAPGQFRSIPAENQLLPATAFPREIAVFVADYNRSDDSFAADQASGVDFSKVGDGVTMRVLDPRGRPLPGMVVTRPPSLVLMLPDPYNPANGVFPDTDGDGRADPIDGSYRIEVTLLDRAGNSTTSSLTLGGGQGPTASQPPQPAPQPSAPDTTPPTSAASFPLPAMRVRGPLRVVDAFVEDPSGPGGAAGSGIDLGTSAIRLDFQGNPGHPASRVRGVTFLHTPNPGDPTRPDFNPSDTRAKILFEIVDSSGHASSLPTDGSADGVYVMSVLARDRAGNAATLISSFEYTQAATMPMTVPLTLRSPR